MNLDNLERAAVIHKQSISLDRALTAIRQLRKGDEQGNQIVDDYNLIELIEPNADHSLELKGCEVGGEIIVAIEKILLQRMDDLFDEAKKL